MSAKKAAGEGPTKPSAPTRPVRAVTIDKSGGQPIGLKMDKNKKGVGILVTAVDNKGVGAGIVKKNDWITHIGGDDIRSTPMADLTPLIKTTEILELVLNVPKGEQYTAKKASKGGNDEDDEVIEGFGGGGEEEEDTGRAMQRKASLISSHPAAATVAAPRKTTSGSASGMYDTVISCTNEDMNFAQGVKTALESAGLRVWMDETDRLGDNLAREAGKVIASAQTFMPILSGTYGSSHVCQEELALAHVLNRPMVPISLVSYEALRIDFVIRMTLSCTAINYVHHDEHTATQAAIKAVNEAIAWLAQNSGPGERANMRTACAPVPVPDMAKLPWWTSTFGHVESVGWKQFMSQLFLSLPVLSALPDTALLEATLCRALSPFGPEPPESISRAALTELGVRVDEFLQSACSDILGLFILSVNTELALGPMSQLRVSVTSAVQSTDDDDVRTLATTGLVWLANAWDPMTRVAALSSLLKIYRKRVQAKTLALPTEVSDVIVGLMAHPQSIIRAQAAQAAGELRVQDGLRGLDAILKQDLDVVARDAAEYAIEQINAAK